MQWGEDTQIKWERHTARVGETQPECTGRGHTGTRDSGGDERNRGETVETAFSEIEILRREGEIF